MQSIIAGLDRGLLATANDETIAGMAARKLEAAGDAIQLPRDLDLLQGRWRLVFSSGFATGSLGGERPGPPLGSLLPLTLGQVCGTSTLSKFSSCFLSCDESRHLNSCCVVLGLPKDRCCNQRAGQYRGLAHRRSLAPAAF